MTDPILLITHKLHQQQQPEEEEDEGHRGVPSDHTTILPRHRSPQMSVLVRQLPPYARKRLLVTFALLSALLLGFSLASYKYPTFDPIQTLKTSTTTLFTSSSSLSRFLVQPHHLPPPDEPGSGYSITPQRKVPPILHYVFGMSSDFGGTPFGFLQYLAVVSAIEKLRPQRIIFWHLYRPETWWFSKVQELAQRRGVAFEVTKAREVHEVFGHPVSHFAHKADIIRLEALRSHGGIYLDSDVFVLRDFAPLYGFSTVMGMESLPETWKEEPFGLCNAVILAQPFAPFISRWLESYVDVNFEEWAEHSVAKPWQLAKQYPYEVTVLNKRAMFWPLWTEEHLKMVHETAEFDFDKSAQFAYHAWESRAAPWLGSLDPDSVWDVKMDEKKGTSNDTSMRRVLRRWVSQELRKEWREAQAKGLA